MDNVEIAQVFENIAKLLEAQGENPYKIRAYQRVAPEVRNLPELAEIAEAHQLRTVPGVGAEIEKKIEEMLATGHLMYYENLLAQFPDGFMTLMDLPGVGPKLAARLHKGLGIGTVADLESALEDGRVGTVSGLGPKTVENLQQALETYRSRTAPSR